MQTPSARRRKRVIDWRCVVLLLLALVGGCAPADYESCVREATSKPTDSGVKMAMQQCYRQHKQPEDERRAAEKKAQDERRVSTWAKLGSDITDAVAATAALGEPDLKMPPARCADVSGERARPTSCVEMHWKDARARGAACELHGCYFRAQFSALEDFGKLWAWWPESR